MFLCRKVHRENYKHPRDEVTVAISLLKTKQPSTMLSVADMDVVVQICEIRMGDTTSENSVSDDDVQWETEDVNEGGAFDFVAERKAAYLESQLSKIAFLYREKL